MTRPSVDATHDPALQSWVESASDPATDFPVQNLPFGAFRTDPDDRTRIGVAIGDAVLDLAVCAETGVLDRLAPRVRAACDARDLNAIASLGSTARLALRAAVSDLLRADTAAGKAARARRAQILHRASECTMVVPMTVGDYTDFYASLHHARNVGAMFRPENPLLPNYKWVPIGYHGRASSIVVSGTPVVRPRGQTRRNAEQPPTFDASRSLDYELEVGAWVGPGNALGACVPLGEADEHVVGLCLVNDWSARDIQAWEYQPLGPFLGKNFATTVSPWVVTQEALAPFRVERAARPDGDPGPLPYLDDPADAARGAYDITLDVALRTEQMRASGAAPARVSRTSFRDMYWTLGQMLAHHTSNGCNLRPGDLIASGTVSGPTRDAQGCLLELTRRGAEPFELAGGERREFLEDGDEVTLTGWCERDGFRRIGFGQCTGVILPAPAED